MCYEGSLRPKTILTVLVLCAVPAGAQPRSVGICDDPARCRAGCDGQNSSECVALGLAMQYRGVLGDPRPLYRKACTMGDEDGCLHLRVTRTSVTRGDLARGASDARKACDTGEALRCTEAADLAEHLVGGLPSDLYRRACQANEPHACVEWGWRSAPAEALAPFQKACDLGSAWGCWSCALHLTPHESVENQFARRLGCAQRACKGAPGYGCMSEAELRNDQNQRDPQIVPLLERSCSADGGQACCVLSFLSDKGWRIAKNPQRARELEAKSIRNGWNCQRQTTEVKWMQHDE
jgi:hypothetical protein